MFRKKVDIKSFKKVYLVHNHNAGKQTFFAAMHRSVERLADEFKMCIRDRPLSWGVPWIP